MFCSNIRRIQSWYRWRSDKQQIWTIEYASHFDTEVDLVSFLLSFSEEEYDEEEEEEEYEEEVQTNPDEYDIFFSNHHSLYIRSISNFLPHKIYWDIKGKI